MYKLTMTLLLVCFCAPFVLAQDEYHKFEVYGGFSRNTVGGLRAGDPGLTTNYNPNYRRDEYRQHFKKL